MTNLKRKLAAAIMTCGVALSPAWAFGAPDNAKTPLTVCEAGLKGNPSDVAELNWNQKCENNFGAQILKKVEAVCYASLKGTEDTGSPAFADDMQSCTDSKLNELYNQIK